MNLNPYAPPASEPKSERRTDADPTKNIATGVKVGMVLGGMLALLVYVSIAESEPAGAFVAVAAVGAFAISTLIGWFAGFLCWIEVRHQASQDRDVR